MELLVQSVQKVIVLPGELLNFWKGYKDTKHPAGKLELMATSYKQDVTLG